VKVGFVIVLLNARREGGRCVVRMPRVRAIDGHALPRRYLLPRGRRHWSVRPTAWFATLAGGTRGRLTGIATRPVNQGFCHSAWASPTLPVNQGFCHSTWASPPPPPAPPPQQPPPPPSSASCSSDPSVSNNSDRQNGQLPICLRPSHD